VTQAYSIRRPYPFLLNWIHDIWRDYDFWLGLWLYVYWTY
jgi:hypothetical protein